MKVTVFLLCYNEALLLKHTIAHYKKMFNDVHFIIYDNQSTDDSVKIANDLGITVINFGTGGMLHEFTLTNIKNNCWKNIKDGWIIVADMDEWLCIDDVNLEREDLNGTTILNVIGYNIVVDSKVVDLSDVNLFIESNGVYSKEESKNICFKAGDIKEIGYEHGAHECKPNGKIKYSNKQYLLKHMDMLGTPYKIIKNKNRYARAQNMVRQGLATHYLNDDDKIKKQHAEYLLKCKDISDLFPEGFY
jgi:glycosyltransferase involved in cell wall biosynthesis